VNLATALLRQGRRLEALAELQRACPLVPEAAQVRALLGAVSLEATQELLEQDRLEEAVACCVQGLQVAETPHARSEFLQLVGALPRFPRETDLRPWLLRALDESWCRPDELVPACLRLFRDLPRVDHGPGSLAGDPLFQRLLGTTLIAQREVELHLTSARQALLGSLPEGTQALQPDDGRLQFACALARQCFLNEYVYAVSPDEEGRVALLRARTEAQLASGGSVPPLWLAVLGCYLPLHGVQALEAEAPWPAPLRSVLAMQVLEPRQEAELKPMIPRWTPIRSEVSLQVRQQYEENPYPRWLKTARPVPASDFDAHVRRLFPQAPFRGRGRSGPVRILVAGCGTGRQPIEAATICPDVEVLAVDLSLSSLAYAKRKARELGLSNIEFVQGDLMELGDLGRDFDLIEAFGVLHHLADPAAGWRTLLSYLQPDGLMYLGLYSELGREAVVAARAHIALQDIPADAAGIRRLRQELLAPPCSGRFEQLASSHDFYSTSACRDLLFHVQEHRFTLPRLEALLAELELCFGGFLVHPEIAREYRKRYPEDMAGTCLENWNTMEKAFPLLFSSMYQFWVQRR
jgi:SAM-dependent methyltransferase